jgi:alcohol dehydrogenase class IV
VASYELIAGLAVIDPRFSAQMPASLTADTGIDVLTHAVEGYSTTWANDFSDGMCLQATRMVFEYLPRAVAQGGADMEAREKMANAAAIAGLGMTNSHIGMAHALGHALGAAFHLPHGRVTGMALPYSIEFVAWEGVGRYLELARLIGLCADSEAEAGSLLAGAVRDLMQRVGLPVSLEQAGLAPDALEAELEGLCSRAEIDVSMITSRRIPDRDQLERIFRYMQAGRSIDF